MRKMICVAFLLPMLFGCAPKPEGPATSQGPLAVSEPVPAPDPLPLYPPPMPHPLGAVFFEPDSVVMKGESYSRILELVRQGHQHWPGLTLNAYVIKDDAANERLGCERAARLKTMLSEAGVGTIDIVLSRFAEKSDLGVVEVWPVRSGDRGWCPQAEANIPDQSRASTRS